MTLFVLCAILWAGIGVTFLLLDWAETFDEIDLGTVFWCTFCGAFVGPFAIIIYANSKFRRVILWKRRK